MDKLKNLKIILAVLLIIFVLVIVKTSGKFSFNEDAKNTVEKIAANNFSISINELKAAQNEFMIVNLNKSGLAQFEKSLQIPFEKLVEESSLQQLKDTDYKIVLVSDDDSQTEKAWIILTQLGIKNVFALTNEENPEVFKYKFQPDTSVKLE